MMAHADEYSAQLPAPSATESKLIAGSDAAWKEFLASDPAGRAFAAEPPKIVRNYNPETDPDEMADEPEPAWCRACLCANPPIGFDGRDLNQLHSITFLRNRIDRPMLIPADRVAEVTASFVPRGGGVWCQNHIVDMIRLIRVYDPIKFNIRSRVWGPPPE